MNTAVILDMYGKPLKRSGKFYNTGYSNGAASLDDPSVLGWPWYGGSPDDDIVQHLPVIRQRCRDLAMNAPVVAGMINTINTNVVGQGLIPEPTPDTELLGMSREEAAAWKKNVLRYWEEFAESKDCDVQRRNNFYEIQQRSQPGQLLLTKRHYDNPELDWRPPCMGQPHSRVSVAYRPERYVDSFTPDVQLVRQ